MTVRCNLNIKVSPNMKKYIGLTYILWLHSALDFVNHVHITHSKATYFRDLRNHQKWRTTPQCSMCWAKLLGQCCGVYVQIWPGDLFWFDSDVEPMVEQLVGRCLEQGYMEAQESLQIDSMRAQQVCCQFVCSFLSILFTFRFKRTDHTWNLRYKRISQ